MAWTFNGSGVGGFPAIAPKTDALLLGATVSTQAGTAEADRLSYKFPELSGAGTHTFGLKTEPLRAVIQAHAANAANRLAFEDKLRRYLNSGRRFVLLTERDETRPYVELRGFKHREGSPHRLRAGAGWYCVWELDLEDMQPRSGV